MKDYNSALNMLKETSRTFFIPITHLTKELQVAVSSAYLCMRAIDEIEDHPMLPKEDKIKLLRSISNLIKEDENKINDLLQSYNEILPEVSMRLTEWLDFCPKEVLPNIIDATSTMADGMAKWVEKDWNIQTEEDLNEYTYYVAGLVGVMLSDLWKWYDDIDTDKDLAIAYGKGLQSVNILRNKLEDAERGVNFFPNGWEFDDMFQFAKHNLALADAYVAGIKKGEVLNFCKIPLALAHGTIDVLEKGKEKLSRQDVTEIVKNVIDK